MYAVVGGISHTYYTCIDQKINLLIVSYRHLYRRKSFSRSI